MRRFAVLSAIALVGGAIAVNSPPVEATEISFESRTYVSARGIDGGDTHALLYEYLALDAVDLVRPGMYLRAGGWGRTDMADETFDRKTNGELQYAFLGWRAPQLNAEARVGRLSLTAGVARNEVFDGLLFGSDLPAGFDVTVFGGSPVEVGEESRSKDSLYGARVSQGRAGLYRLGASYLKEQDAGNDAREEAGADLFLAPLPLVEVTGSSLYNASAREWSHHEYRLVVGPFMKRVRLTATWAATDYRHYFQGPVNSVFSDISPAEKEKLDRIGGEVEVVLGGGFTLSGEYTAYQYDVSGSAQASGAGLDWNGTGATAGGGYRRVSGDEKENRYQEFRAYATAPLGSAHLFAGAEHLAYEEAIDGRKNATTGTLSLGYNLSRNLEVSATAEYGKTPEYDREVKGLLAVLWRYDASIKKGGTK